MAEGFHRGSRCSCFIPAEFHREEGHEDLAAHGTSRLTPQGFRSGRRPWIMDYLAGAAGGGAFTGMIRLSQPSRRLSPELCVTRLVRNQPGWPSGVVRSWNRAA